MSNLLKQFSNSKKPFLQYSSPFTPFNSWKVMYHLDRMHGIKDWMNQMEVTSRIDASYPMVKGTLPPPVYVTIDPTNVCNHGCPWCLSASIQESDNTTLRSTLLLSLADVIMKWNRNNQTVNAIVLAGGGEPLANKSTPEFIEKISKARFPQLAMITNGELLNSEVSALLAQHATWVGFSVDAGNSEDHQKQHAPKKKGVDNFKIVIDNIAELCDLRNSTSHQRKVPLNIGYKFNIHPNSYKSILQGAKIAKEIGCDQIQYKPTYVDNPEIFTSEIIEESQAAITEARGLYENSNFKVVGMIHKVGPAWEPIHDFSSCMATPLGLIFSADGTMYLCCDRRGVPSLQLGAWHNGQLASLEMINTDWGSKKHYDMIKEINLSECPRCSFRFYNQFMDEGIENDPMNHNFL
jgi:sulfatase maturation enzyme AslB (radical SAM superfamily)